jgi:flagellar basal body-associated protein FliL
MYINKNTHLFWPLPTGGKKKKKVAIWIIVVVVLVVAVLVVIGIISGIVFRKKCKRPRVTTPPVGPVQVPGKLYFLFQKLKDERCAYVLLADHVFYFLLL